MVPPDLAETLAGLAEAAAGASEPWWIIGSTAVLLHGGAVGPVKDVDVMMSPADAESLLRRVGVAPGPGAADGRFRSPVFGTWTAPPVPVEVMGGLSLAVGGEWRAVALATRGRVIAAGAAVYLPSREELVRLLEAFGRPKDLARAGLLASLG